MFLRSRTKPLHALLCRTAALWLIGGAAAITGSQALAQTANTPPAGYASCAIEYGRCSFSGTASVVFGARNSWSTPRTYTGGVDCTNTNFGDPIVGVVKSCYVRTATTTATTATAPVAPSTGTIPAGYSLCAAENQQCNFTGAYNVIYGANSIWTLPRRLTGGVSCTNGTFGDPVVGTAKSCYIQAIVTAPVVPTPAPTPPVQTGNAVPAGYSLCATESQRCSFTGVSNVVYGARTSWTSPRSFTGGVTCSNATFGDPLFGVFKSCYVQTASAPAPAPVPPVASTPPPASVPTPPVASTPPPALSTATAAQIDAARLLTQATFGPNMAEIQRVSTMGPAAWIDQQLLTTPMDTHWAYAMERRGPPGCTVCTSSYINAVMESFWLQAVRGPDQLRQRTALALSEMFVVSNTNSTIDSVVGAHASYLDMLSRNAFGNFRTLLEQVATHPAMGQYLSHFRNEREDPTTGRLPDENFAREVMQLFTIGLWQLNPDGTRRRDANGNYIPTYVQDDVSGLAKVFTGWSWGGPDRSIARWHGWVPAYPAPQNWREQMQNYPEFHSRSEKRFLGVTIPANTSGEASLRIALDTLFNHPNTGPFIGRQLIQRMVTSNPSPAYVARVSAAFNNNGSGVRGDMRAVLRAVLLDADARNATMASQPTWGKLREPMVRFGNWMRAFDARSTTGGYPIWNLEDNVSSIGQNPLRAPSVFNWFRPDYAPPGEVLNRGLVAPEFQITHETTATGYVNFVTTNVQRGHGWNSAAVIANYTPQIALASNPGALMDHLNLLMTAGRMSASTRQTILEAVNAVPASQPAQRVHTAVALTMISADFIVQK